MSNSVFVNAEWCKYDAVAVAWSGDRGVVTFVCSFVRSILSAFITEILSNKYHFKNLGTRLISKQISRQHAGFFKLSTANWLFLLTVLAWQLMLTLGAVDRASTCHVVTKVSLISTRAAPCRRSNPPTNRKHVS